MIVSAVHLHHQFEPVGQEVGLGRTRPVGERQGLVGPEQPGRLGKGFQLVEQEPLVDAAELGLGGGRVADGLGRRHERRCRVVGQPGGHHPADGGRGRRRVHPGGGQPGGQLPRADAFDRHQPVPDHGRDPSPGVGHQRLAVGRRGGDRRRQPGHGGRHLGEERDGPGQPPGSVVRRRHDQQGRPPALGQHPAQPAEHPRRAARGQLGRPAAG